MNKIIIANWKMNPQTEEEAINLAQDSDVEGLIICPPFPFLPAVKNSIRKATLGAQDMFWEESGAYTGEVSGPELQDLGVEYVIIGHSERRKNLSETDEMVAKKMEAAIRNDLVPILCIGETKEERDNNKTKEVLTRELTVGLGLIKNYTGEVIIAYEPIWAIGTGIPDTPENIIEMIQLIKETTEGFKSDSKVIYGGSVNSDNAEQFLQHEEIEGALVGGASLRSDEIKNIIKIAKKHG